jgi:hypothetical protein
MPIISGGNVIGGGGALRLIKASYSFAANGGAVGTLSLSESVPQGAVILGGWVDVTTAVTSGGAATVAVTVESAGDIVAAAAVSGAPWSTTGRKSVIPVFTGATTVKTTAARTISVVIATAALTAGVFDVYLVVAG